MTRAEALTILTEMNKWRRAEGKYEESGTMPYSAYEYGKAIDFAIGLLKGECNETKQD